MIDTLTPPRSPASTAPPATAPPATAPPATAPPATAPRRTLSLERKLPLLMTAVLALGLATSVALNYRALSNAAVEAAATRLTQVARIIASTAEGTARTRVERMQRASSDPVLRRVLRAERSGDPTASRHTAAIDSALSGIQIPNDSGLPVSLWTADGRRIATLGTPIGVLEPSELGTRLPPALAQRTSDSVHYEPMYESGGRVYYQVVAPVVDGDERLGYIVALRRINGTSRLVAILRGLTGEEVTLYTHHPNAMLWAALATGRPTMPSLKDSDGAAIRPGVGRVLATDVAVAGTPWMLTLEEPVSAVLDMPRGVLATLSSLALLLTAVGAVASWFISRRITRPLVSLTAATEAIARGDYASRVVEHRGDEIGRLAHSFNLMATDVEGAQQALAQQFDEATAVAGELARANHQLQHAMQDAEVARDAAEQANRAKSDFLAVMSHELRTPLNAIAGYADLMQLGIYGTVTAEQDKALARIVRSQQHLLGLINDVLNFAKLSAGKVEYDLRDVPVADLLTAVETMIAPQVEARALHYEAPRCDGTLLVRADQDKVQQVLLNLLSNAVKFTAEGGTITVTCARVEDGIEMSVHDTGVGIPADRLRHIFEPFVQVDRALNRPHDGVGLGLAISHDLACGMGGALRAVSTLGEGSTFTLRLPAA